MVEVGRGFEDAFQTGAVALDHVQAFVGAQRARLIDPIEAQSTTAVEHTDGIDIRLDGGKQILIAPGRHLAAQLNCPFIRVFPDDLPADQEENATIDLIIKGLVVLGDHAKGSGVKVLLESHGKVVRSDLLLRIMEGAGHRQVGLVWDVYNMWSVTKESSESAYKALKKYIDHVHIKDARWNPAKNAARKPSPWMACPAAKAASTSPMPYSA